MTIPPRWAGESRSTSPGSRSSPQTVIARTGPPRNCRTTLWEVNFQWEVDFQSKQKSAAAAALPRKFFAYRFFSSAFSMTSRET